MTLSTVQLDRAIGAVVASAAGDALGSPYEFRRVPPDDTPLAFGRGTFGHGVGEWTDDTSMAMPILAALARGESLTDPATLGTIVGEWLTWSRDAQDVGSQTRHVLSGLRGVTTEESARHSARAVHDSSGRSAGNGSLMRTGPVALGYLDDGQEPALVEAATRIAALTHWEADNADACAIWSLAVRHAVRTGALDVRDQVQWIPEPRRERWLGLIDEALAPGSHPRDFESQNVWVVKAFQGALAAVCGAASLVDALDRAIRGGNDTDTVAAIAGSLAGAVHGATAVPLAWQRILHGWPGLRVHDLTTLAILATRAGEPDSVGWPTAATVPVGHFQHTAARRHPHDAGVWLGSQSALTDLPAQVDAVVSLSRVGSAEVPAHAESVRVWLVDQPGHNANLELVLTEAADTIAALRSEGRTVFVHCAEARSRTAAVAALYSARHRDVPIAQAWDDVAGVLPLFRPAPFLRAAVDQLTDHVPERHAE